MSSPQRPNDEQIALAVAVMARRGLRNRPATNQPTARARGMRMASATAEPTRSWCGPIPSPVPVIAAGAELWAGVVDWMPTRGTVTTARTTIPTTKVAVA
jgi:hypothetical protein